MVDDATIRAIELLRGSIGRKDFPIDRVVSELLGDYEAKCQALSEKEKQEQQFHNFMEALAVKLKKANALTMVGALEEAGTQQVLITTLRNELHEAGLQLHTNHTNVGSAKRIEEWSTCKYTFCKRRYDLAVG